MHRRRAPAVMGEPLNAGFLLECGGSFDGREAQMLRKGRHDSH